ncbi:ATP-binding cassette domain-containing protein [Candidatus Thiosymbion oneisti]|uniref:ATP-binding cassette domain-containing protein n=1 Tax=Candidatus Thiosymbion oneisti TaxID=589554 RepID=UPI000B7E8A45|nr:ATP-binding cassette domain-containing protein [Candidatus Thiosymbion oneisti]
MRLHVKIDEIRYQEAIVLSEVDFQVQPGEVLALFGKNGTGKSSLFRSIMGIHGDWNGTIQLGEKTLQRAQPHELRALGLAYMPQSRPVFDRLSIRDNLRASTIGGSSELAVTHRLLNESLKSRFHDNASVLSGGEKQALGLSMIFATDPKIALLDEPCASLSAAASAKILSFIKEQTQETGMSVLIIEQKVQELIAIADKVLIFADHRVAYNGNVLTIPTHLYNHLCA